MGRTNIVITVLAFLAVSIAVPSVAQPAGNDAAHGTANIDDPRPVAPPAPDLVAAQQFDCATASINPPPVLMREIARIQPQTRHAAALTDWYGRQFVRNGVWTQDQADSFAAGISARPELADNRDWSAQTVPRLREELAVVTRESQARNYAGACRALMAMLERVSTMPARYSSLWANIDAIYAAEAARLGVTLPQ